MQDRTELLRSRQLQEVVTIIGDKSTNAEMLRTIIESAKARLKETQGKISGNFGIGDTVRIIHNSVDINRKFKVIKFMKKNYRVDEVGTGVSLRVSPSLLEKWNKK